MEIFPNWTAIPIILFIITLVFILNRTFFRPLGKTLESRHSMIEGARKESEEIRKSSQEKLQEFDKKMRAVRLEAGQIMAKAKQEAQGERSKILTEKREEAQKFISQAKVEIQRKKEEARSSLEQQSQEFAYSIASRILHRPIKRDSSGFKKA